MPAPAAKVSATWISIHALREESDRKTQERNTLKHISIHALREESDLPVQHFFPMASDFNPRSP